MTITATQKTIRGLIAIAVVFLVAILVMGMLSYRLADLDRWTVHTHEVIEELKDSLSALQDVETGERGYIVTGEPRFLEPYDAGIADAQSHLQRVLELTADNAEEQQNVAIAKQIALKKIELSKESIASRSSDPTQRTKLASTSKQVMDNYRRQMALMIQTEKTLLEKRSEELRGAQLGIWTVIGLLTLSGLGLLNWVYRITRAAIEDEKRRAEELNSLNTGLQQEIEQRRKTEIALKDATVKLSSSNADLQQFAYVASHDLQEPLRAVAGFVTLIARKHKGTFDPETEGWINHAVEGSQRMRTLINDLLVYARVESRGKDLAVTDCNKALSAATRNLQVAIDENEAEIEVKQTLPNILGEEAQIAQLFQNLIGNAIKFRQLSVKPVVSIVCTQESDRWHFCIKDNGIGFEQEHEDRIFVIFQRLQGRDEYKGTGIGLALCKKIVERHGGRIWTTSKKGEGSEFHFTFPVIGANPGHDVPAEIPLA